MIGNISLSLKTALTLTIKQISRSISVSSKEKSKRTLNKLLERMPREREYIVEAQKQRQKIKEKAVKYIPGRVNLQVLGNGSPAAPAAVYLFTDQNRYLFNCGEGTQRLAHEHKTKLSRLEHIFITRSCWNHLGGLPGLTLTVQDAGVPNLYLHGPPGLDEIFGGMKRFVVLKDLKVNTINCENGEDFEDQVMTVKCIPLKVKTKESDLLIEDHKNLNNISEADDTDYYEYECKGHSKNSKTVETDHEINFTDIPNRNESVSCLFICKLKPKPGFLDLEKCVEKGVKPGPLLGQLKNGFDIELPDGTIVKADDVRAPTDPGPVFIFVDVPNENYLVSLEKESDKLMRYQENSEFNEDKAALVIHFTPKNIVESNRYQKFMKKFSFNTQHLILNSSNIYSGFWAAHRIQHQLNQINNKIFPLLREATDFSKHTLQGPTKKLKLSPENVNELTTSESVFKIIPDVVSLTSFNLRPKICIDRSFESKVDPSEYVKETNNIEGFEEALVEYKNYIGERIAEQNVESFNDLKFPKILFLGTGSCIPNKTRNVSSILLSTNENSFTLFDCGEGTLGQIVRFYGQTDAISVLRNLKAIYISHLHADHHIGLIGLLKERQKLNIKEPLLLFAPVQIKSWLNIYNTRIEEISGEFEIIPNGNLINESYSTSYINKMGVKSISTCLVRHCPHAFGVSIELLSEYESKPIKITYSGDTVPCNDLVQLGMNSTILIHEATMEDELQSEAIYKMHSTVSQAISQGNKMNAQFTILTHFSQRYAKLPRIEKVPGKNVGLAFDNMIIGLDDLKNLPLMYPVLKIMFAEHCEELEQRAVKRALKKERKLQF